MLLAYAAAIPPRLRFASQPNPQTRDFTGAVTLLEFNRRSGEDEMLEDTLIWLGYCAFHLGNYEKAIDAYQVREGPLRFVRRCSCHAQLVAILQTEPSYDGRVFSGDVFLGKATQTC